MVRESLRVNHVIRGSGANCQASVAAVIAALRALRSLHCVHNLKCRSVPNALTAEQLKSAAYETTSMQLAVKCAVIAQRSSIGVVVGVAR